MERDRSALLGLLQRQECLEEMGVYFAPSCIFPIISALTGSSIGERLKRLQLECASAGPLTILSEEDGRGVAALTRGPRDFLPALETLVIDFKGASRLQLELLLGALARGAAPNLRTLTLHYPDGVESKLLKALEEMLGEALEARRHVEGCKGLAELKFYPENWDGPDLTTYPRTLWAALLPTIERGIKEEWGEELTPAIVDTLLEFGAPNLRELKVEDPRLARGLSRFPRLENLVWCGVGVQMLEAVQEAAAGAGGWQALPSLREIILVFTDDDEDEDALVEVMGQGPWFPGLRKLYSETAGRGRGGFGRCAA
jgi:hypothetical protein